ncbi:hypothetical protein [Streptomyces durhamensis]|uniref:hypothetical protein n=1 Tax=Streptomyces durhamensis TaxID=68194 RepID=UPI0004CCEE25|nr:hypothetical protein [Streptomyces durhamensis]
MPVSLPRIWPSPDSKPLPPAKTAEVFRVFARDLAAGRRSWDGETAHFVAAQFDQRAADWDTTRATGRDEPLRDALDRGGPFPDGACLELGSGTGLFTRLLRSVFPRVISVDLPAADVVAALPGDWQAVEANAGWGSWAVLRRAR